MLRRSPLQILETLVEYDGPQVVTARDSYGVVFLCVAVPDADPAKFFGARISPVELDQFYAGRIDLFYALTYQRKAKRVTFSYDGSAQSVGALPYIGVIPDDWLPARGFFWEHEEDAASPEAVDNEVVIGIDGRWDIEDLADFPQKLAAPYAFLHALMRGVGGAAGPVMRSFQRYPWRGGFSTVFFYRDLYGMIPAAERVTIQKIHYASPGQMVLQASASVMEELHRSLAVADLNKSYEAYRELHREMSNRSLLGRSSQEVTVDAETLQILREGCIELSESISFALFEQLFAATGQSYLLTAKLLLAYYRRLEDLASFYESGKAEYRGQLHSSGDADIVQSSVI